MIARRPRTLAFDSMERRDLTASLIDVQPGGLIDIEIRNVLNKNTVQVDILRNAEIIKNAVVVVDIL
jgi:hypothetical protein